MALKTGTSIAATGTLTQNTISTLTFGSTITLLRMINNTANDIYFKFNGALVGGAPTIYDGILLANSSYEILDESISIDTISVYTAEATHTLPRNEYSFVGW